VEAGSDETRYVAMTMPQDDPAGEIDALQRRDERVLAAILERDYPVTLQLAALVDAGRARERARAAWLELFQSGNVEGAPSLRTWLLRRVLTGQTLGQAEPASAAADERFEADDSLWAGHWAKTVAPWSDDRDWRQVVEGALRELPPLVAAVVILRDVDRLPSEEVEAVLGLDSDEQRVLLHEGRTAVRDALDAVGDAG
jgi:RNA polymerase sigma-70 factor, ECF subfamily